MADGSQRKEFPVRPTRRGFMQAAGAAAAMAAAGRLARAAEPPLRIGVVGTGSRGCDLIRHLTTIEDATIAAVCDDYAPHLENGLRFAGEQAEPFAVYESMLDTADLDALVVATPLHLHYPMCVDAIERGLAVFCEKTLCHSIEEAKQIAALVEKRGALFQVGLQRRSNPIYAQAEAMVRAGMLGVVTAIKCQWHRNAPWRRGVPVKPGHSDYDALERRLNWRLYNAYSQGLMAELGSHQLDVVNRLLGCAPERVIAMGGIDHYADGREVYDNVFCAYEYRADDAGEGAPRTVRATFSSIQTNAHEGVSETIMGTKGTLFLTQKKALFYREGGNPEAAAAVNTADGFSGASLRVSKDPWAHRGRPVEIDSDDEDSRAALVSFVRDVRAGNRETACTARIGLENTATVLIANEAIRTGQSISFPEDCRIAAHA